MAAFDCTDGIQLMKFNIFKKKAPKWSELGSDQKAAAARRLSNAIKAMSGPRYKVVSGPDKDQRERGKAETVGEDRILDHSKRGQLLDLVRNQVRNSPTFNGILKQFDLNAVGTKGGKVVFGFEDADAVGPVRDEFAKWTRDADFFDGLSLNSLLKIILKTYVTGGDCVLLFDDGLIEDSGRILLYEPDEIGSVKPDVLKKRYGSGAQQSLGRVYNANGRFIGAVVSKSQRGREFFDEGQCYFLSKDPSKGVLDQLWMMPRNVFRIA